MKCRYCDEVVEDSAVAAFCPNCGHKLGVSEAAETGSHADTEETGPARADAVPSTHSEPISGPQIGERPTTEVPPLSLTGQADLAPDMSLPDLTGGSMESPYQLGAETRPSVALALEYDAAGHHRVGERGYLRFRAAAGPFRIEYVGLIVRLPDGRRSEYIIRSLGPGAAAEVEPVELVPDRAGEALVDLQLTVLIEGGYFTLLRGRLFRRVERSGDLHVHAGRDIIGLETIDRIDRHRTELPAEQPRWTPVRLDIENAFAQRPSVPQALPPSPRRKDLQHTVLQESGPALIALHAPGDRSRVFVYGGTHLTIGRDARQVLLAPRTTLATSISGIRGLSKLHCEIRLAGAAGFIVDRSKAGTFVHGARLPKDLAVRLAPGDLVALSDTLAYRVSLFADAEGITGLLLAEERNSSGLRRYLLLRRAVPLHTLFHDCAGWLELDGRRIVCVADNREVQAVIPGGQLAAGRLLVNEAIRCRGCGRSIVPLPEADSCIYCRELNKD